MTLTHNQVTEQETYMKATQIDFTQGSITKKMLLFSWPIFLGNLLQSSYQIIDSLWVGNLLGANALGAVAISSTVIFTILSFIIGINGATITVLSQRRGANDKEGLKQSLNAFVVILGGLSVGLGVIGFFISPWILSLLGTPESIAPIAQTYLQINFLGIVFLFGYNFIGTVLRALGDSKTPVRFIILAVVINAVLSPIMISWMGLGIHGAAISTIISQGIAFTYGIIYCLWKSKVPFTLPKFPDKKYTRIVFKLGLPGGLQMMAISGGVLAIMSVVTSFGEGVVAGFGAAHRIESFIILPALTLGSAVNSMAGQNIGSNLWERVSYIAKNGIILILIVSLSISSIIFFSAEYLIKMFVADQGTIQFGATYLRIIAFFYPFLCIMFIFNGIIRASGAMFQVLALNLISFWLLRYPFTYFFSSWLGEDGIALGIGSSFIVSCLLVTLYYLFGKWRNVRIFHDEKN